MRRFKDNLVGVIGLCAWSAISATNVVSAYAAGPRVMPFISTLLARAINTLTPLSFAPMRLYACYLPAYVLSALVFAWSFWSCTRKGVRRPDGIGPAPLVLQIAIAALTDTQLMLIVALELAYVLLPRRAVAWMALQTAVFCAMQVVQLTGLTGSQPLDLVGATLEFGMSLTWLALAFGIGYLASSERRGRMRLASLHADLQSTQHLMMDALRLSERASISRNLHDAVGHHLTALNLHLELALRQAGANAPESLRISRDLAGDLLQEVRAVVSLDQEQRFLDLRASLQVLVEAIPSPQVVLHYDETVTVSKPENAHVILRCVQEAVTNAIRHAGASLVEVHVRAHTGRLSVRVTDDGAGVTAFREGNGLRGMRERLQALHGTLEIHCGAGRGFHLHASLPAGEL